jgi:hypothetical protein
MFFHVAETVKVPQMAESISEGTLKAWSKQEGDTVAADEEVATIETDKVSLSTNALRRKDLTSYRPAARRSTSPSMLLKLVNSSSSLRMKRTL